MGESRGVLVMSYGTPRSADEIEAYYTDIRRGRPPSAEQLAELTARYDAIGGHSPLFEITEAQARGIAERIPGVTAYVGQKHAAPFIADAIASLAADGVERAVGIVMAPHYSTMSIGDYARRAFAGAEAIGWAGKLEVVESWHLEPGYIEFLATAVSDALGTLSEAAQEGAEVVFTAHSLPVKILAEGDPYAAQLGATAAAVAGRAGLTRWRVGWQSAGRTEDEWIGPDIEEIVSELASSGVPGVVVCPCGFVTDHLEVLYDLDVATSQQAEELGIEFARTRSPNDDPRFLDAAASVVRREFGMAQ